MLNLLIFVMMFIFGGFGAYDSAASLLRFGAQNGIIVASGDWFRTITSMFVHGGFLHLFFNMYALFYFGNMVERIYGKYKYLSVYVISGFVGNLLTQFLMPTAYSVGASGAIFGLIGLLFGQGFRHDTPNMLKPVTGTALLPVIIINVILGFTVPSVNNFAHIGGLAAGFTFGWLTPVTFSKRTWNIWKVVFYVLVAFIALCYVLLLISNIKYRFFIIPSMGR